jgi:hypothetical protein
MPDYECYFLNEEHHFRGVEFFTEADDSAAIATSRRLFAERDDYAGFEVWEGARLLTFGHRETPKRTEGMPDRYGGCSRELKPER